MISRVYGLSKTYKTNKTYIYKLNNNTTTHACTREISISKWQEFLKSYDVNKAIKVLLTIIGFKFSKLHILTEDALTWTKEFIEIPRKDEDKIQFLQEYCNKLELELEYV